MQCLAVEYTGLSDMLYAHMCAKIRCANMHAGSMHAGSMHVGSMHVGSCTRESGQDA